MRNTRRKNISTAKLGVLFIVSAMALAGIGAGYAAWFDTVEIEGLVSTGSVEWYISDYSGTYAWKVYDAPDTGYGAETVVTDDPTYSVPIEDGFRVAYAEAVQGQDDHHAVVTYDNLFPSIDFAADIEITYTGLIPGKINDIVFTDIWPEDEGEALIDQYTTLYITVTDEAGNVDIIEDLAELAGYQLHENYVIHVIMTIHLPQDDAYMLLTGDFGVEVTVVQWNEYPYEGGGCGEEPPIGHHADVMLTIDTSGSVSPSAAIVRQAAKAFVSALLSPDDAVVGIVSWDIDAWLETTFITDIPTLHGIIDGLVFDGPATNLEAGIILAQNELATADRTPDSGVDPSYPDYMVIITDGVWNTGGNPQDDADAAKAAGTTIFVLAVGSFDKTVLEPIASPGCYYDVTNWEDLEDVLLSLVIPTP